MSPIFDDDYPPPAFYFSVSISKAGDADAAFQEVSGIGSQIETESYAEGGENRFTYQLPKAVTHPKLVLKRGIANNTSSLFKWCKSVLEGGFNQPIATKSIYVILLNAEAQPARKWSFANAYPVNWEVENFNATKNEVAIEKIELAYTYSQRFL